MKQIKLIVPLSIALISAAASADESIYHGFQGGGGFGNLDLNEAQYPSTMVQPRPSRRDFTVSLNTFLKGNPDDYPGDVEGYVAVENDSGPTITSLDTFLQGNPDHQDHAVDYSLPVIGSAEALAAADARCAERAASSRSSEDGGV